MMKPRYYAYVFLLLLFTACERDFDIDVKTNKQQLIVEAYINNEMPEYNYVVLSRSQDYYAPDFSGLPVKGAEVSITEGSILNNNYVWDPASRVILKETNDSRVPEEFRSGVYFDPVLATNPARSLIGKPGKYYLLEITAEGKKYSSVTGLLQPVSIDSLTCGYTFTDVEDSNKVKSRITIHYQDPDTIGNRLLFYRRTPENQYNFGWGGLNANRRINGTDDLTNGQYMRITQPQSFVVGDSVQYMMVSVERKVYEFWESYNNARENDGPFATPVTLLNTITGEDVTGCFSGFSISSRRVKVY
jgi:hypothetical protein